MFPSKDPQQQLANHLKWSDRMRAEQRENEARQEHREETANERLRLDVTSVAQQLTGISVICTFIASMVVALISLANDVFSAQANTQSWDRGQIYFLWYLSLIYSLTTAIAAGASAVFAFARANGRIDAESRGRVIADCNRVARLVLGYSICFSISVALLFVGLLFFVWVDQDQTIMIMIALGASPLWGWLMIKAYQEWRAVAKWPAERGAKIWSLWREFPWSKARWGKSEKEKDLESQV